MKTIAVILGLILFLPGILTADSGSAFQMRPVIDNPSNKATKMLDRKGEAYLVMPDVLISENDLEKALISEEPNIKGQFRITVFFRKGKSIKFYEATKQYSGQRIAILIDKKLIMAPKVLEPIRGDSFIISGIFSHSEAKKLAELLNSAIKKGK